MKKLLLLLCFVSAAHAGTVIAPVPIPFGKPCLIKFGDDVMVNLSAITLFRYYPKGSWGAYEGKTVLFVGDRSAQLVVGNAIPAIEARLKECEK